MRSMHVHPQELLKNESISAGALNLGERKRLQNGAWKTKKNGKELRGETFTV